jgi:hypothetical protein
MTGDDWKPYEGTQSSGSVERKASEAQMAALAD